ncbi:MAG: hypothetical protein Q4E57_10395, partial [Eubacteriales bacterium]|nr:hypothetical protein [Eubacteriales bacterium]
VFSHYSGIKIRNQQVLLIYHRERGLKMNELLSLLPGISDLVKVPLIMLITALSVAIIVVAARLVWKFLKKIISTIFHRNSQ